MFRITEQTMGMGGPFAQRNLAVKPDSVSAAVTPPQSAASVVQVAASEQNRSEEKQEGQEKEQGAIERWLQEERKRRHPDPLDKAIQQAMSRMVNTRQAAERFLLGAGVMPVGAEHEEGQRLDAVV
ncbi:MAG: hypothetical protein G8345_02070 [Magnetococcales bacterium]|nr:hypothetical protein [Magnetococcales bacterium]NGZ25656.1 hypothetical protein [Magnetococcales bacterium]